MLKRMLILAVASTAVGCAAMVPKPGLYRPTPRDEERRSKAAHGEVFERVFKETDRQRKAAAQPKGRKTRITKNAGQVDAERGRRDRRGYGGGDISREAVRAAAPERGSISNNDFQKKMVKEIRQYLGTPYRWGGTTRRGIDCSGLVNRVYESAAGVDLPRRSADIYQEGQAVSKRKLAFGDLVFFRTPRTKGVGHVGIYLSKGYFVHASQQRGVVYSKLDEEYYRNYYIGARRVVATN